MRIAGKGWELHVERFAVHTKGSLKRTFGRYQVYLEGAAQPELNGFICEAQGPGDNSTTGKNKRRVEAGRYQLYTQFGDYRSVGHAEDDEPEGTLPMPGFRLANRGVRTDILVHPGHPPTLYLSSIGCLNPTEQIGPREVMDYWDSRRRVIAMLESLKAFAPTAFKNRVNTEIPGASIVIDGEPMRGAHAVPMAAAAPTKTLSGPEWVLRFPDGGKVVDLEPTFRAGCEAFIAALRKAGATIDIHSTRRPRERAYLMNAAWRIAKEGIDPQDVRPFPGVDIEWVHRKRDGAVDKVASRKAAAAMVKAYDIAFKPALNSNHVSGKAIDMTIRWSGSLNVANAKRKTVAITGAPRNGMNPALWPVAKSYGVTKLTSDRPHWSANGR
jgi:hypothetical protein